MTAGRDHGTQRVLDAADDFRQAAGVKDLWARLHRHLADFGVTGLMYGAEAFPDAGRRHDILLSSYDDAYVDAKMSSGLYHCDEFVRAARVETAPILWSDAGRLEGISPAAKRSLAIDWDFGVLTGVTLPMRFNSGLGVSALGLHAAALSWADFDRIWFGNSRAITGITHAFDVRLREAHVRDVVRLAPRERECLLWLAAGLRPQQIAHRLGTHEKTVEKQIERARHKLNAVTNAQAVATALVYGLIVP
ncbi:helix-turn-helix transcriptional regulator [Azospirillum halopraeferens]|uniref:helix-turn-helix transcriptional regulator n=1 Tax=Azospirillum halopraeferens TaxID=34010 RepID=UPI000417D65E|nr:autoinducer binding domain-containing protein [Azospirillum halopraeferens]